MNRRWICGDVWMDILPSFDRPQLGLKMALLSDRFDALVDTHFDGKSELTIWRLIRIEKDEGPTPKLSVLIDGNFVEFPLPDRPLPNKIRFKNLRIEYIDHSVISFLRSNKPIWDRSGTKLEVFVPLYMTDVKLIWDVFTREIWPIFATNIRNLGFTSANGLDNFRRRTSPTILTDLDQLHSINSNFLLPDAIADDGPDATARQVLAKWLHTPSKNGQPKRLHCIDYYDESNLEWISILKAAFPRATSSVSFIIRIDRVRAMSNAEPFELENERTKEKLTLEKEPRYNVVNLLLKRYPIDEKAAIQWENWDANLNKITFHLWGDINKFIGPLSPPTEEKADE